MSLVRGRKESKLVRSLVLYVKLGVRLARRRCGSHLEVADTVNKCASNECSFGCGCPTHNCNKVAISLLCVIASVSVAISRKGNDVNYRKYSVQNFQVSACVQSTPTPSRQSCEIVAGVFVPALTDSKDFLRRLSNVLRLVFSLLSCTYSV